MLMLEHTVKDWASAREADRKKFCEDFGLQFGHPEPALLYAALLVISDTSDPHWFDWPLSKLDEILRMSMHREFAKFDVTMKTMPEDPTQN